MKKLIFTSYAIIIASIFLFSCTKDPIYVSYVTPDKEVCLTGTTAYDYVSKEFPIDHADVAALVTADQLDNISSIMLKSGVKVQVSTSGYNLDQISSIELYLKEKDATGLGQQIAYSDPIGLGATEVNMQLNGVNVKDMATKDMTMTVKVLNKSGGNTPVCLKLTSSTFEIKITP
ncbi:MAG: hypothetical protein WCP57_11350 [Bacteroidota bacterium]